MPVYRERCYVVVVLLLWMASPGTSVLLEVITNTRKFTMDFSSDQFSQFQGCLCSSNTLTCRVKYGPAPSFYSKVLNVKEVKPTPTDKNQTGLFQCKNTFIEFPTGEIKCTKQTEVECEREGSDFSGPHCCSQACDKDCIPLLKTPDLTIISNRSVKFCYPACQYLHGKSDSSTRKMAQTSKEGYVTSGTVDTSKPENSTRKNLSTENSVANPTMIASKTANSTTNATVQTLVAESTTPKVSLKAATFNYLVNDSTLNSTVIAKKRTGALYRAMLILAIIVTLLISAGFIIWIVRRRFKKSKAFLPTFQPPSAGNTLERMSNHAYEDVDLISNDGDVQSSRACIILSSNERCPPTSSRTKNRSENQYTMVNKVGLSHSISTDPAQVANSTKCNSVEENESFEASDTASYRSGTTNIYSRLHQKIRKFGNMNTYDVLLSQESLLEQRPSPELCVSQNRLEERCYSLVMPTKDPPEGACGGEDTTVYSKASSPSKQGANREQVFNIYNDITF